MNDSNISVPLYFITGFLGSGKTTLLNRVLDEAAAQGKKTGVIINEWGQASVDAVIVRARDVEIEELNNGQVFCSCLSTDFIRVLALYAERDLDAVVVETSGMANPMPLHKLLLDLKQVTGQRYDYRGMTALVDPDSFLDLVGAINAVDEQILASRRIIINKIDLATESQLEEVRGKIRMLNPKAAIIETSFAKLDGFFDEPAEPVPSRPLFGFGPGQRGAETQQRPGNFLIKTSELLDGAKVEAFFREVLPGSLRVKGVFRGTDGEWHYADGVNEQILVQPLGYTARETLFVVIPRPNRDLKEPISKAWMTYCGVPFSLS